MSELVDRLRRYAAEPWFAGGAYAETNAEAADRIEELEAAFNKRRGFEAIAKPIVPEADDYAGLPGLLADLRAEIDAARESEGLPPCKCGSVRFGVGAHWPGGHYGKVTCSACGSEQEGE